MFINVSCRRRTQTLFVSCVVASSFAARRRSLAPAFLGPRTLHDRSHCTGERVGSDFLENAFSLQPSAFEGQSRKGKEEMRRLRLSRLNLSTVLHDQHPQLC